MAHTVVMVTTSYPRFPGDNVGSFMEPIARRVAARGHAVHIVAPWHPLVRRPRKEDGVHFHFFRYAPLPALNVFGYSSALRADTTLRLSALVVTPLALAAGWLKAARVAHKVGATVLHGHWVVPGGAIAAVAARRRPLVISLHGSDVYLAERHAIPRYAARAAFARAGWTTACSDDLRRRAIAMGAAPDRIEVVPYGVDADRFRPDPARRARRRAGLGLSETDPLLFAAGRFVTKKGFDDLIDATARLTREWPAIALVLAGGGDLEDDLRQRASGLGLDHAVRFVGMVPQDDVAEYLAAADVAVVPSAHDESGNVDGLPNTALEALASGTPLVATRAGGLEAATDAGRLAVLVPERDPTALAEAIADLLRRPARRRELASAARQAALTRFGWDEVAARFERAYDRATRGAID